ncbi:hypothetical protein J0H58_19555 [bacterium]|nr:hypothetical protein [bacterium]
MNRLLTLLTLLALLGTRTRADEVPAQDPAPAPAYYYPVQKGARWVYLWKVQGRKDEERIDTVTAVESGTSGAKLVTASMVAADGRTYPTEKVEVSDKGVFNVANLSGLGGYFSPWCQLKLPRHTGQSWKMHQWDDTMLVDRGVERIQVPAGEFDAVRVDQMLQKYPTAPAQTRWYARGVGKVKHTCAGMDISLKSFTPGEERAR